MINKILYKKAMCLMIATLMTTTIIPANSYYPGIKNIYASENTDLKEYKVGNSIYSYQEIDENSIEIVGYEGNVEKIKIPEMIDKKQVVKIGNNAFEENKFLKSIEIPGSVYSIGNDAFIDCKRLNELILNEGIVECGYMAFAGCTSLEKVKIPSTMTETKKLLAYTDGPFADCTKLHEVEFGEGIQKIGSYLFGNCTGIENIIIPESVTEISEGAFADCKNLKTIKMSNKLQKIGDYAFEECTALKSVEIPENVYSIGNEAFKGCKKLNELVLNEGIVECGYMAFADCTSLEKVKIPSTMTEISTALLSSEGPFSDCTKLHKVEFGEGIQKIGSYLFGNCTGIENVIIPESVTEIGEGAFSDCKNLQSIKMSSKLQKIGDYAFEECTALKSVEIPGSVYSIGNKAFKDCKKLNELVLNEGIVECGYMAFADCTSLEKVKIPTTMTEIGTELLSSDGPFLGCSKLRDVTFQDGIKNIGDYLFANCIGIESVIIPDSVKTIGDSSFLNCKNLTIYGKKNSVSEKYAKDHNIAFGLIDEQTSDENITIIYKVPGDNKKVFLNSKLLNNRDLEFKEIDLTNKIKDETIKPENVKFTAYSISISDENNKLIQLDGKVIVKIPCKESYNESKCKVYRYESDGSITDMKAIYQDGYMVFDTDHFSTYIVTETELKQKADILYGDANGDGQINTQDAVLIKKYLAEYDNVDINLEASDVNGDGEVTSADAVLLLKYLAEYDVILGN